MLREINFHGADINHSQFEVMWDCEEFLAILKELDGGDIRIEDMVWANVVLVDSVRLIVAQLDDWYAIINETN